MQSTIGSIPDKNNKSRMTAFEFRFYNPFVTTSRDISPCSGETLKRFGNKTKPTLRKANFTDKNNCKIKPTLCKANFPDETGKVAGEA